MNKVKARLKEFVTFSPNYETFEKLFWDNLDRSQTEKAIALLLQNTYAMLKGDGERFEELLAMVDEAKRQELKVWLESTIKRVAP